MNWNKLLCRYGILLGLLISSCKQSDYLLVEVDAKQSGILFENQLEDTQELSILDYMYFYNGGGVAVGDINNDGLQDVYFISNQNENKLYLNQGNLRFNDITDQAQVAGKSDWNTGVSMVDINNDGWLDIYVCAVTGINGFKGYNELFVNQQDGTFKEQASQYGLAIQNYSVSPAFFDYDHDGDLDLYLLNHGMHATSSYTNIQKTNIRNDMSTDKLFRNDNGNYVDVSEEANLKMDRIGYGLAVNVADINQDGWDDLYVSNDFFEGDLLYLNQQDGTFKEVAKTSLSHTSQFSMGNDIADLNHDSFPEIISLDMLPEEEKILKSSTLNFSVNLLNLKRSLGYLDQFPRNHLQYNTGRGKFLEIAQFSGVAATDWSWSALFSDLNLDGYQDLFVSNGIYRRPNDADYIKYVSSEEIQNKMNLTKLMDNEALAKMPSGAVPNYVYQGIGELKFQDQSSTWVKNQPSISNGTAMADFDLDGDIDLVLNNFNTQATLYENKANERGNNYLHLKFEGDSLNTHGIGAKAYVYTTKHTQYKQVHLTRGYQSSMPPVLSFGLGEATVDSLRVVWPNGLSKTYTTVATNQLLQLHQEEAITDKNLDLKQEIGQPEATAIVFDFTYEENSFPEFNREKLLPYGITTEGPGVASADVNSDGFTDVFIGGAKGRAATLFLASSQGYAPHQTELFETHKQHEDVDAQFIDIDLDGDLDLFVVSGGGEYKNKSPYLKDRVYLNDGKGDFIYSEESLPAYFSNGSVVRSSDINQDGYPDFFIGTRAVSGDFAAPTQAQLLINKQGKLSLSEDQFLSDLGMVTDAFFIDYDKDGDEDLWVVAEWAKGRIFQNNKGEFIELTQQLFLDQPTGLWQSTTPFDIDLDGDIDLVVGNVGLNTKYTASSKFPLKMYRTDVDNNGQEETLLAIAKEGVYYPFDDKDRLQEQLQSFIRKRFNNYIDFAGKPMEAIFGKEILAGAEQFEVSELRSGYFENTPEGYQFIPFGSAMQWGPIRTMEQVRIKNQPQLFIGGSKVDLPPFQAIWEAQPPLFITSVDSYDWVTQYGIDLFHNHIGAVKQLEHQGETRILFVPHNKTAKLYKFAQ